MNQNDQRIRKHWLVTLMISMSLSAIGSSLSMYQHRLGPPSVFTWVIINSVVSFVGMGFLFYYCAYRKPGTKLLTFSVIASLINFPLTAVIYFSGMKFSVPIDFPYYKIYLGATYILGAWWVVICWKMRRVNKRLQQLTNS